MKLTGVTPRWWSILFFNRNCILDNEWLTEVDQSIRMKPTYKIALVTTYHTVVWFVTIRLPNYTFNFSIKFPSFADVTATTVKHSHFSVIYHPVRKRIKQYAHSKKLYNPFINIQCSGSLPGELACMRLTWQWQYISIALSIIFYLLP